MMQFSGSYIAKFLHPYSQPRSWRETPCTPRRRFARLTCKFARTRRCYHTKTGAHLREHRSNLHVMWSSQLARSHLHVMWSSEPRAPRLGLACALPHTCRVAGPARPAPARSRLAPAAATCTYAKRSTPSLETRAKNSGSNSGALSPKTRASRKMRSPSSRRLSSPVRSVAITSPFST